MSVRERSVKGDSNWLRNCDQKIDTESTIESAKDQTLNTNSVKRFYHLAESDKCKPYGKMKIVTYKQLQNVDVLRTFVCVGSMDSKLPTNYTKISR